MHHSGLHPTQHKGHQRHPARTPTTRQLQSIPPPPRRAEKQPHPQPRCTTETIPAANTAKHRGQPTQTPGRKLILGFRVAATHAQTANAINTGHTIPQQ